MYPDPSTTKLIHSYFFETRLLQENILFQLTYVMRSLRGAPVQNKPWRPSLKTNVATLFADEWTHVTAVFSKRHCRASEKSTNTKYTHWQLFGERQINLQTILVQTRARCVISGLIKVTVHFQGCLVSKRCSASGLSGRYLNHHIKLKVIELAIKLHQEFWNEMNNRFFQDH